jgi:non-specific serine/threonine protein kinase
MLTQLLAAPGATQPTAARAAGLIVAGAFATRLGDYAAARPLYEEALPIARGAGDPWILFSTLVNLAWDAEARSDYASAQAQLDEALITIRAAGERVGESMALGRLGWLACRQGDCRLARARCEEGLAIARAAGDSHNASVVQNWLGHSIFFQGDVTRARAMLEESVLQGRQEGDRYITAQVLDGLGLVALEEDRHGEARALLAESLQLRHDLGDQLGSAESLESMAGLAAADAQPELAGKLVGAAAALREAIGTPLSPMRRAILDRWLLPLRQTVDPETFERGWAAGRVLPLHQAVAEAQAGAEPPPARSAPIESGLTKRTDPLTPREQEVAALVAHGLSNRQIARRLVVTDRTVAAHVEHILDKLAFTSRTQIGVWAAEHGLAASSLG